MELVPIIYWTLVGFGIVTLLILITSYLTFQLKRRFNKIESDNLKNNELLKKVIVKRKTKIPTDVQHHPKVKRLSRENEPKYVNDPHLEQHKRITILNDQPQNKRR